jgi:TonB-linked SusC/RagA family outer membrane protein
MKKNLHKIIFTLYLVLVSITGAFAQTRVSGTVTDDQGATVIGATVKIKGTTTAVTTNTDGNYAIDVPANATLVFSFVGSATQEVAVGSRTKLDIKLLSEGKALDEVVVVGYGTVKKSDVSGSLVSLVASDLTPGANVSVQQMMQGRASGVQISQRSGEPGSAMSVKIRGVSSISGGNDPLYVIDGMPVNNGSPVTGTGAQFVTNPNPRNPLNSLNPSDIQSIEILKDASATAIYGSRGANGVVLITTKRGSTGAMKVNYNAYYGFQRVANSADVLSPKDYHDVLNAIVDAGGGSVAERVADDFGTGTNWQPKLFRNANTQSHDVSVSGGNANSRYFASLGYYDQTGVVLSSGLKRYTARVNIESSVANKYAVGVNITSSFIKDNIASVGTGINESGSALYSAIYYDPTSPIYNPNGTYYRSSFMTMDNPLALIYGQTANSDSYRTFGTAYAEYFLIPSLSVKARVGGDVNSSQKNVFIDPSTTLGIPGGVASILTGTNNYYMGEGTVAYKQGFGKHDINAVAGVTYEHFGSYSFSGNARGFALPDLTYNALGSGNAALNQVSSGRASTIIASYLARVNYTYNNKYILTASFRADGSSRFGPNNAFGYFPSAALAWKLQEEDFIKQYDFINELKARVSYGAIGNQNIANYLYIPTYSIGGDAIFGANRYASIAPSRNENPDLKWEAAKQFDVGLDFGLFNSRIRGSIEYYKRNTDDLLLNLPQPLSTGFGSRTVNIGAMTNSGVDIQLGATLIQKDGFTWTVDGNVSFLKNKVLNLGPLSRIITGGAGFISNATIIAPGESINSYYGYDIVGTWQTGDDFSVVKDKVKPGDIKYRDVNNDGTITDADRVILGKPLPDMNYGLTNTISYKGLSLTAYIEGTKGSSILNAMTVDSYFPISFRRNKLAEPYLNRWTPTNPTNEYPSFVNPTSQGQRQVNSKTVESGDYLRLQSARLSYNVPMKNKFVKSLNVYATGNNLFTITKYKGVDPAVNSTGDDVLKIDFASYPYSRTFLFGLNVQF